MRCKCNGEVIEDGGELVCTSCGIVAGYSVESPYLNIAPPDTFGFTSGLQTTMGTANRDHAGRTCTLTGALKRMRRSNKWSQTHNRSLPAAMAQLLRLRTELHMGEACSIYAADLLRNIINSKFLTGRTLVNCVAAVALIACRKHSMNTTMENVASVTGVDKQKLYVMYRNIIRRFDVTIPVQDPVEHIAWIAGQAGIGEAAKRDAHRILQAVDRVYMGGKDPVGMAASALYTACIGRGEHVQRDDIAGVAGVAGTTLSNNYKTLRNYMPDCVVVGVPGRGNTKRNTR